MPILAASKNLTPEQRRLRSSRAALIRWGKEDPKATAERGQAGLLERFRREVLADDPAVVEPELTRRAECRRRAHMAGLSFLASKARARKSSPDGEAA